MKKLFVIGCPRSGTTMVQQALNHHPAIVIPPETKFFFSFIGHSLQCQLRHLDRLQSDLQIRLTPPSKRIQSVIEGRDFYEDIAGRYLRRLNKQDAIYFGDKTPEHTGHVTRVQKFFPDAKIIFLYRDGRDVALSLTKVPWMSADVYVNFLVWLYYYRILKEAQRSRSANLYFARYEDLVADPDRQFGTMLDFLGLPFERAVTHGFGNREGIPEREYPWKARALEPISSSRIAVFQRELALSQIATLERLGREALPALGYPFRVGPGRQLSLAFVAGVAWNSLKLVRALPWHSVANEFLGRSLSCGLGAGINPRSSTLSARTGEKNGAAA